jgi:hypothetical protein
MRSSLLFVLVTLLSLVRGASAGTPCVVDPTCGDGNFCNGIERCIGGECAPGLPLACDDADPCTRDACETTVGCTHVEDLCPVDCSTAGDGTRCADGSVCTRGDVCAAGLCAPGSAVGCDDGDACTRDVCDPALGCVYTEETVGFPCVPDCNGGVADYSPCPGDGDICTRDACLPSVDLIGNPHMCIVGLLGERQCQDGDVCNGQEFCSPVLGCEAGPPLVCDDGDDCNGIETCDPLLGCGAGVAEPDGTACDDHRECTIADACAAATCVGSPLPVAACDDADAATADACEEGFGCLHCLGARLARLGVRVAEPGRSAVKVRGELTVGTSLAPAVSAVSVLIDDGAAPVFRADLPAGALVANANGTRFLYRDRGGDNGSVRVLRLRNRNGIVKWSLVAQGLTLPAAIPAGANVRLVVGSACFVAAAPCAPGGHGFICR